MIYLFSFMLESFAWVNKMRPISLDEIKKTTAGIAHSSSKVPLLPKAWKVLNSATLHQRMENPRSLSQHDNNPSLLKCHKHRTQAKKPILRPFTSNSDVSIWIKNFQVGPETNIINQSWDGSHLEQNDLVLLV